MSDLSNAIKQICDEKGLSYDAVITTIESALAAAYRKDYGKKNQNIVVNFDPDTARSKVFDVKEIIEDLPEEELEDEERSSSDKTTEDKEEKKDKSVETRHASSQDAEKEKDKDDPSTDSTSSSQASSGQVKETDEKESLKTDKNDKKEGEKEPTTNDDVEEDEEEFKFNPKTMIQISDAKMIKKTAKIGEELKMKLEVPEEYGRMAAQTAKQVIIQRLREAEREMIFNDFKDKENEVVSGVVQRREGKIVLIDLGKAVGVLPPDEMINNEDYRPGDRIKVYVKEVNSRPKGPEIVLSRKSEEILKKVFYLEIPEIANGLIELKSVAREAGYRSKVAVLTDSDNVDPIGSCVGQRGARIQTIIAELGGEKVDIIQFDEDPIKFITNALSPAKIIDIDTDEKEMKAQVKVAADQLSLAIGKGGQNARLAAKLTGWKIDIVEDRTGKEDEKSEKEETEKKDKEEKSKKTEKKEDAKTVKDEVKKEKNNDKKNNPKKGDKEKEKDDLKKKDKDDKKTENKKEKDNKKEDKRKK